MKRILFYPLIFYYSDSSFKKLIPIFKYTADNNFKTLYSLYALIFIVYSDEVSRRSEHYYYGKKAFYFSHVQSDCIYEFTFKYWYCMQKIL